MMYVVATNPAFKGSVALDISNMSNSADVFHIMEETYTEVEFISIGNPDMWPEYWPLYKAECIEEFEIKINEINQKPLPF